MKWRVISSLVIQLTLITGCILAPAPEEDGEYVYYHPNGTLKERYYIENGVRKGNYSSYYDNGSLEEYYALENGHITGTRFLYFKDGQLWLHEERDEQGDLHGLRLLLSEEGDTIQKKYYVHGELQE